MAKKKMHLKLDKGALHREMGVPKGEKLNAMQLHQLAHNGDEKTRKRAQFALNARKWHHK